MRNDVQDLRAGLEVRDAGRLAGCAAEGAKNGKPQVVTLAVRRL